MGYQYINLEMLEQFTEGDTSFSIILLESFTKTVPGIIADIKQAMAEGRWVDVASSLHKIKPTVQYIGVNNLTNHIKSLEEACLQDHISPELCLEVTQLIELIGNIEDEVKTAISQLQ